MSGDRHDGEDCRGNHGDRSDSYRKGVQIEEEHRKDEVGGLRSEPYQGKPLCRQCEKPPPGRTAPAEQDSQCVRRQEQHGQNNNGTGPVLIHEEHPNHGQQGQPGEQQVQTCAQAPEHRGQRSGGHASTIAAKCRLRIIRKL